MVHLSPGIRAVEPYPFEELDRRKAAAIAAGRRVIDLGVGDPREETPEFIRDAFIEHDAANAETYRRNAEAYKARIAAAVGPLRERIAAIRHYDRWLEANTQVPAIGLGWDCQLIDSLPREGHDQAVAMVVTPTRTYEAGA